MVGMTTLRERQRERRRTIILDAAEVLISEKGFEDSSVGEIAERSQVGVATVYNYFGTKSDLLHSLLERYIEAEAELGEDILNHPNESIVEGMTALFSTYLDGMLSRINRRLLSEFLAMAFSRQFGYGLDTYALKTRLLVQCRDLASHYKQAGRLRDDITADEAATVCYGAVVMPLALFALDAGIDIPMTKAMIRRNLQLLSTGIGAIQHTRTADD